MFRIFKIAFISFFGFFALLIFVSLFLPSKFKVERSIIIKSPVEAIEPYITDLHRWPEWSVWNKKSDSTIQFKYFGANSGKGAILSWSGKLLGRGTIEITDAYPAKFVCYKMTIEDEHYGNDGEFTFSPVGFSTKVTWKVTGDVGWNPVARYFVVFMEKFIAPDFEKGLAKLKSMVESSLVLERMHEEY